ncbi:hypothetical protein SEUCBS139899_003002 [Sporothrix eucalyptigena]|uniref:Uncharacterized protein n=1 Tax=Sporothrix eucalyptigena TaxID=1812306 RepID=A0ABP0C821_9PEZI
MTQIKTVEEFLISHACNDTTGWRYEEAHTLRMHSVTKEVTKEPSADARRTLERTVVAQVRSRNPTFPAPDITKDYILDWTCYAVPSSPASPASAPPLTVDGLFEHPTYRALPTREPAWCRRGSTRQIADWRPIAGDPFRDETALRGAMLQRVQQATNASWKNNTTLAIRHFGFMALDRPL